MSSFWMVLWSFLLGVLAGIVLTWLYARRVIDQVRSGVNKMLDGLPRP